MTPPLSLEDPENLRRFVRSLREGIYVSTPDGRVLEGNPAFFRMFGVSSLEELGRVPDLLVDPGARDRELELLARDGVVRDFELGIRRKDGELRTVIDTCYVCGDPATGEKVFHGILIDITDRKRLEEQLLDQILRDPLTGCFNRRFLARFAAAHDPIGGTWGCIMVDVDGFKLYNDRFGHAAGDAVLTKLSRFLMRETRSEEVVVRMGGDEFLVVLPGADEAATESVVARLKAAAEAERLVPFSMGWATRTEREHLERTIVRADRRMIVVKNETSGPLGLSRRRD
ncbi:MAG TPA: sensor domain-containing diguanylate cyclase [Thermoanaerobaculia bacterium]|nr:sensor domain-containing diguanylate cyclase [Thermoanaerobaculia bacterium]HQR67217.1 sensor domain-containing diguanylate cyclase [Thermoanaerobaculia bacterium]